MVRTTGETLKERIYSGILERILKREFSKDDFLSEIRLAEQFSVSRAPVREALVALCNDQIVQNIPRVGYRIVAISLKEVSDALAVRQLLEREAARLALRNLDAQAESIIDAMIRKEKADERVALSVSDWLRHGEAVHLTIAALSRNGILEQLITSLIRRLRLASTQTYGEYHHWNLRPSKYHLRILKALKRRNETDLLSNLEKDIDLTNTFLRSSYDGPRRAFPKTDQARGRSRTRSRRP